MLAEIDSTTPPILLGRETNRHKVVGKPTVYRLKDFASRMTLAVYVTLDPPSYMGLLMTLVVAAMDKVSYCALYDVPIEPSEWPYKECLPERLLGIGRA